MTGNAPSPDRLRHADAIDPPRVDAVAFRQGWRVRTRLDALLAAGRIDAGIWQAACAYRDAWERALTATVAGRSFGARGGGADPHTRLLAVAASVARLHAVETRIGQDAAALCYACVVEDRSWASIGAAHHRNPETMRDRVVIALRALAWAWGEVPGVGPPVGLQPPTPRRRVGRL